MQKDSPSPVSENHGDATRSPMTVGQNALLTVKILVIAAAIIGALWACDRYLG